MHLSHYDSLRGAHHISARNVKYSGGLQSFIEVPIRPNPITLAHCKMLPAIPTYLYKISVQMVSFQIGR